jgi:hypothetical protein
MVFILNKNMKLQDIVESKNISLKIVITEDQAIRLTSKLITESQAKVKSR